MTRLDASVVAIDVGVGTGFWRMGWDWVLEAGASGVTSTVAAWRAWADAEAILVRVEPRGKQC